LVVPLFTHPLNPLPAVGSLVALSGAEAKHAIAVRRMRVGEAIQLANGNGARVIGSVASIDDSKGAQSLTMRVNTAEQEPLPNPAIHLVQALAKGDRDELAIQAATELGVIGVLPWQAERSVSRWDGAKVTKGVERWQTIVAEAAKQALRAYTPKVSEPVTSNQLVKRVSDYAIVLVLDPTAERALVSTDLSTAGTGIDAGIAIVVGPEGGISDSELAALEGAGAVRVRLGSEILRTSTAGLAAISVLQGRLGNWD